MGRGDSKVEALRAHPLLDGCSNRELERLAGLCDWITEPAGTVLTTEGRTGLEFFLVVEGVADVLVDGAAVGELGRGDFFGELALLERGRPVRRATVVARERMGLYVFDARGFATVLAGMPQVAAQIREQARRRQPRPATPA